MTCDQSYKSILSSACEVKYVITVGDKLSVLAANLTLTDTCVAGILPIACVVRPII